MPTYRRWGWQSPVLFVFSTQSIMSKLTTRKKCWLKGRRRPWRRLKSPLYFSQQNLPWSSNQVQGPFLSYQLQQVTELHSPSFFDSSSLSRRHSATHILLQLILTAFWSCFSVLSWLFKYEDIIFGMITISSSLLVSYIDEPHTFLLHVFGCCLFLLSFVMIINIIPHSFPTIQECCKIWLRWPLVNFIWG